MVFEVKSTDLLGRVGKLKTKNGVLEAPTLLPVVNPRKLEIKPKEIFEEFKYKAIMTNAYLFKKYFEKEVLKKGIHGFLGFPNVVMTDSGAYQLLRYGKVEVEPIEILDFQEKIGSDIGVILDIPTGFQVSRNHAEWTVKETLERAKKAVEYFGKQGKSMLLTGPIQGGTYFDLLEFSAKKMSELPFDVYALGSPTKIMEQYLFDILAKMMLIVKKNLPLDKPLHLFGAGHPFMFSFAVALGFDLFDSASYALYAKDGRYITETGTIKLENLEYFPCNCPVCKSLTPQDLKEKEKHEKEVLLMKHNLYVCKVEVERIKQSIVEGRLWELLELRARTHPALFQAFKVLSKYSKILMKNTPVYKFRGMFIFDEISLYRPEILTHKTKIVENYEKPEKAEILLLLPQPSSKPFHKSSQYKKVKKFLEEAGINMEKIHVCFYSIPFGIIPVELDEVYPLSQFEDAKPYNQKMVEEMVKNIVDYVKSKNYKKIFLHPDFSLMDKRKIKQLKREIGFKETTKNRDPWSLDSLEDLSKILRLEG